MTRKLFYMALATTVNVTLNAYLLLTRLCGVKIDGEKHKVVSLTFNGSDCNSVKKKMYKLIAQR